VFTVELQFPFVVFDILVKNVVVKGAHAAYLRWFIAWTIHAR